MTTPAEPGRLGQDPASGPAGASAPRQMIGRYRLTRRLGSGSFATVWQGHDDDLDVPVAVKVLADNWADNADVRNRFLSEARIMRRIRDVRIVRVYDIGTLDDPNGSETDRPYFVMDYADGGSLESLRKRGLPPVQALRLCAEASRALHVLHQHDVVHRDVTPGNILLNRANSGEMQVLIADLGVAKSMIGESGATMTAGTPAYMAIEQATGIGQFDHRADIYSLTAVTYAMLTGRPPFAVRTLADLLGRDINAEPAPIAAQLGAPASLDGLILSGLSPQPGRRPPTATVLADALDQIANEMERLGPQPHWSSGAIDPQQRPSPMSYPTPSSYLQSGGRSNLGPSQVGSGGYPHPQGSMAPQSMSPQSVPPQSVPPQSMAPQPWAPTPPPASMIDEPDDDGPRHGSLFYIFVGIALLALFFVSLLLTVVLRG